MKSLALSFLLSLFIIGQATAMSLDGSLRDGHGSNVLQVRKRILNCSGLCSDQLARCTKAADVCSRQMCTEEDFAAQAAAFDQCFSNYQSCLPGCANVSVRRRF
jgi:hypothetical protein